MHAASLSILFAVTIVAVAFTRRDAPIVVLTPAVTHSVSEPSVVYVPTYYGWSWSSWDGCPPVGSSRRRCP